LDYSAILDFSQIHQVQLVSILKNLSKTVPGPQNLFDTTGCIAKKPKNRLQRHLQLSAILATIFFQSIQLSYTKISAFLA
jgi:hypothetical protein